MVRIFLRAAAIGAVLAAGAVPCLAQSYKGPSYGYTTPPYSYQPPAYSYTPPSYSYQPPGYSYTTPGQYRRSYRANTPDYNDAYQYPWSAYGDPRQQNLERRKFGDPSQNRFAAPEASPQYRHAPPYQSSPW